jgi:hypothetical protein
VPASVSVGSELLTLEHAIEGVAALVEVQRHGGLEEGDDIERGVSALLALVGCRVRDLGRVVRGAMPADLFLARHNESLGAMAGHDPDLLAPAAPRRACRSRRP